MDTLQKGLLKPIQSDEMVCFGAEVSFDPRKLNGIHSIPVIKINPFSLSEINQELQGGGYLKIQELNVGNAEVTGVEKTVIKLDNVSLEDVEIVKK